MAVNPLLETKRPVRSVHCPACRDHGYLMPALEFPYRWTGSLGQACEWDGKGAMPYAVLFLEALPCVCVAGDGFRKNQAEVNRPARAVAAAIGRGR
jgi:hypothetical protein